jgi:hypothetical protein
MFGLPWLRRKGFLNKDIIDDMQVAIKVSNMLVHGSKIDTKVKNKKLLIINIAEEAVKLIENEITDKSVDEKKLVAIQSVIKTADLLGIQFNSYDIDFIEVVVDQVMKMLKN